MIGGSSQRNISLPNILWKKIENEMEMSNISSWSKGVVAYIKELEHRCDDYRELDRKYKALREQELKTSAEKKEVHAISV